ncbi:MAG: hypothetical protein Q8P40_08295 [Nitrospirota bacterium]|nr:hypothetical protein [Nitrospirota bacterium]
MTDIIRPYLFEETLINSLDIDIENQAHNSTQQQTVLAEIDGFDSKLAKHFHNKIRVQPALTRQLVSFQANKPMPVYRWYKYKEALKVSGLEL